MSIQDDPVIQDIKAQINDEIDKYTRNIAEGGASSYDDYKRMVGVRKGLKISLNKIDDCLKFYLNDIED